MSRTGQQFISPTNLEPVGLPLNVKLLPEYLSGMGYTSHMLGRWNQGFCSSKYLPTNRGFSSFYGTWASGGDHYNHIASADPRSPFTSLGYDFHQDEDTLLGNIRYNKIDLLVEKFSEIMYQHFNIEKGLFGLGGYPEGKLEYTFNASSPFFVLLNFDNLKLPLNPEERFEAMYPYQSDETRKKYLASLSNLDDAIGRIISNIRRFYYTEGTKEKNLFDDTVIIFTSTSSGLSGGPVYSGSSSAPLAGQQGDMLEGGCKVPSFVTNIGTSGHVSSLVHISDWLPTIYAGLAAGNQNEFSDIDGINQIDVLHSMSEPMRTEILYDIANFNSSGYKYTHVTPPDWPENFEFSGAFGASLRIGDFKLSVGCNTLLGCTRNYNTTWSGNTVNTRIVLINLKDDPREENNLAEEEEFEDKVAEMSARLLWHVQRSVEPLHADFENNGLPIYSFPPGQFFTGWCDEAKYDTYKNVTNITVKQ